MGNLKTISIAAIYLLSGAIVSAQEPSATADGRTHEQDDGHPPPLRFKISAGTSIMLIPSTDLYPPYMADLRQPRFSLRMMSMIRRDIIHTPRSRLGTSVGGHLGLFRIHPADRPDLGFQIQLGAGGFAQWEKRGRDGIGWDGVYHLLGTWTNSEHLAIKLGINHTSSHVIDEHMENTGRRRIGYTREETIVGMSYLPVENPRTYIEIGYAHLTRSVLQKRLRFQAGLEYQSDRLLWNGLARWFMALDAQTHEENDWKVSTTLQVGLRIPMNHPGQILRTGLEFSHGRSPMGEFFQADESHIAWGWWLDL